MNEPYTFFETQPSVHAEPPLRGRGRTESTWSAPLTATRPIADVTRQMPAMSGGLQGGEDEMVAPPLARRARSDIINSFQPLNDMRIRTRKDADP